MQQHFTRYDRTISEKGLSLIKLHLISIQACICQPGDQFRPLPFFHCLERFCHGYLFIEHIHIIRTGDQYTYRQGPCK